MNNEELDSQLSAMFDDELPAPECELLARRLARDEVLKARWGRYAAIGACIRMERGVRLHGDLAGRVSRAVAAEPSLLAGAAAGRSRRGLGQAVAARWWQPVAGGAVVAASVAAAAIFWLRAGSPDAPIVAQVAEQPSIPLARPASILTAALPMSRGSGPASAAHGVGAGTQGTGAASGANTSSGLDAEDSDSYVVPPTVDSPAFAPPTELANFVVAHSEYSMPLLRRSVLSSLVADGPAADEASASGTGTQGAVSDAVPGSSTAGSTSGSLHAPHADAAH